MTPEWYYPNGTPVFRFSIYSSSDRCFPSNKHIFESKLSEILASKRPELPFRPGKVLIVGTSIIPSLRIVETNEISNKLMNYGFNDTGNWDIDSKHDPSGWWANSLCFDVIGLPPYYVENSQSLYMNQLGYSRLFVRPNYTWTPQKQS